MSAPEPFPAPSAPPVPPAQVSPSSPVATAATWPHPSWSPVEQAQAPSSVDYPVFFVPQLAQAKAAAARRNRTSRIVSLALSLAILAALYWFFRDQLGVLTWPTVAIALSIPGVSLVWAVIKEVASRREASGVPAGLAVGICRGGLLLPDGWLPWEQVGAVAAANRRFGRSDDLVVTSTDGCRVALPLAFLSGKPATIDGAFKAMSAGRVRIDFSKLDV